MTPTIWAQVLWVIMGLGLVAYAVTGGADLGAGIWSLLASGPRKEAQRQAVAHAIGPIWEANHVWLIFVIVVMFSAFSKAFAAISIALHIPIALALLGIIGRGAAYVFQAYGIQSEKSRMGWARLFAWSSTITPLLLGLVIGALSSSQIRVAEGVVQTGFVAGWLSPFALLVGGFSASLFALLSAVYLAVDTEGELAEDFRRRAIVCEGTAFVFAVAVFWSARGYAPDLFLQLIASVWTWPIQLGTGLAALSTLIMLFRRHLRWARISAAAQVALVVVGWGAAMDQHFMLPDVSLASATTNPAVLPYLVLALGAGALLLGPALWMLYRVFKTAR